MNILFVASEGVPFVKTGGLADVIGSLPIELRNHGIDIRVVLPKYGMTAPELCKKMSVQKCFAVTMGWRYQYCSVLEAKQDGITYYFIGNEYCFNRSELYGYKDDAERFAFFSKAVLKSLPYLDFKPQVIHAHDWQSGLLSVFLKNHHSRDRFYRDIRTVFTVHNLYHKGLFPKEYLEDLLELDPALFSIDGIEFYGQLSFLKGGLVFSDYITTVSPTYAQEIKTSYYGEKLEGLLQKRSNRLKGIINGIDYSRYNPATDPNIFVQYTNSMSAKAENKIQLQEMLNLPKDKKIPVIAFIGHLVEHKGLELITGALKDILVKDVQLVFLGTGSWKYESYLQQVARHFPDKISVNIQLNDSLARKIYAGADIFIRPSKFEPCGLSQMIAMRYGTIPLVRETGGLRDTVTPFNQLTGEGNGFSFKNYNPQDMFNTICQALECFKDKETWKVIAKNAQAEDFSWKGPAQEYIDIYRGLLEEKAGYCWDGFDYVRKEGAYKIS